MNQQTKRWAFGLIVLSIVVSFCVGCAQDVPDINRVQPRAIKKELFRLKNKDGSLREWYFRQTVIEVPYGSGAAFVGEQGKTEKVVWDITERFLYAYRSREYVINTDNPGKRPGVTDQERTAIAAYRIEKHFDVQRGYNPATGEQTNVILENAVDRPWNERAYMRVNFSKNLVTNFDFVSSRVKQQPIGYAIPDNEKGNKDRAKLTEDYIDIVNKIFIEPEMHAALSKRIGRPIAMCLLYTHTTRDCLGQTVKIRSSFMLAKKTGYVTKEYSNIRMNKFGFFRSKIFKYDRGYGVIEDQVKRIANRWGLWENEKSCAKPGQRLSHANCKTRKIPYYINEGFPKELKPATVEVIKQWNVHFADVVRTRSGKKQEDIFVFCPNNPVQEGDPAACGKAGTNPQIGDLRYSFIYWVSKPHRRSPLGYGPSAADPVTGEIISANAFIYGGALDKYSNYAVDLVRLLNGDLKGEDLGHARQLLGYYKNLQSSSLISHNHHVHLSSKAPKLSANNPQFKKLAKRLYENVQSGRQSIDWVATNIKRLENHPNNAALLSGTIFKAFNLHKMSPTGGVTQELLDKFGPTKMIHPAFFSWHQQRTKHLSERNVMMADFMDDGILARALKLKKEFTKNGKTDYKKAYEKLRNDIYLAVTLHEVGHNLGLRHNFAASADTINFHDHYWKLRGQTRLPGSNEILPFFRYKGANRKLLDAAIAKGMHEYQYSSIMDYGSSFASDLHGLGKYDRAAILYGYGDLVEVFKKGKTVLTKSTAQSEVRSGNWHYTQLPRIIAGNKPFEQQVQSFTQSARQIATIDEVKKNKDLVEVPYKFCSDEYHHGTSECNRFDMGADTYERVHDMAQRYWGYYILNSFKRGRVEFGLNVKGYLSRIFSRYFLPITHQYKHFMNDGLIIRRGVNCGSSNAPWYGDDRCGQAGFVGAIAGLNFFSRVMQTPDLGCYKTQTRNGRTLYEHNSGGQCPKDSKGKVQKGYLEVPIGPGRQMLSTFDKDTHGYDFYWKPINIGGWWDKYLAVLALGDTQTRFLGVDRSGNARSFLINYSNMFGRYIGNIIGGFLAGTPTAYGPYVSNGKLIFREEITVAEQGFNPNPQASFVTFVDPNEQYMAKLVIGFAAAVFFAFDSDNQNINEALKISVRGLSESPEVPEKIRKDPNRYVEIVDPGSNRIYYAARTETTAPTFSSAPPAFSAGFDLLKQIKDKHFESDGRTLKNGSSIIEVHREFRYIKILMGWLRIGEYNRPNVPPRIR